MDLVAFGAFDGVFDDDALQLVDQVVVDSFIHSIQIFQGGCAQRVRSISASRSVGGFIKAQMFGEDARWSVISGRLA